MVLERLGEIDAAIGHYLKALSIDPNRRAACFALGRLLYERGRVRDAISVLQDGFRRHGTIDPAMLLLLADAHAEMGEFEEARAAALQALALVESVEGAASKEAITARLEHFERGEVYPKRQ